MAVYFRVSAGRELADVVGTRSSQLDARSEHQTRVAMGVCLSKPPESSPRVDAGGGSAASRPESASVAVVESVRGAEALEALTRARPRRAGKGAAANDHVATKADEREPQRRKIDAGHSVAMDTGASGSNPPMPREGYVGALPRFPAFSRFKKRVFPRASLVSSYFFGSKKT